MTGVLLGVDVLYIPEGVFIHTIEVQYRDGTVMWDVTLLHRAGGYISYDRITVLGRLRKAWINIVAQKWHNTHTRCCASQSTHCCCNLDVSLRFWFVFHRIHIIRLCLMYERWARLITPNRRIIRSPTAGARSILPCRATIRPPIGHPTRHA